MKKSGNGGQNKGTEVKERKLKVQVEVQEMKGVEV